MKKSAKFLSEQPSEEDIDHSEFDLTHRLGPTYDSLSHCRDKSICFGVRSMSIKCSIDYRYPFFLPPIMICWDVSSKSRKVRAPITKVSCSHDEIDELKAILPYKKKINETDAETLWQKRLAKFDSTTTPVYGEFGIFRGSHFCFGEIYIWRRHCVCQSRWKVRCGAGGWGFVTLSRAGREVKCLWKRRSLPQTRPRLKSQSGS